MKKTILHISASSDFGGGPDFILDLCKYSKNNSYYYCGPKGAKLKYISKYCKIISNNMLFFFNPLIIRQIINLKIKNIHLHGRGALIANLINLIIIKFFAKQLEFNIIFTPHGVGIRYSIIDYFLNIYCNYFVDILTFVSKDELYVYKKKYNLRTNYLIIKNGIFISKKISKKKKKNKNIISFSRFNKQKNSIEICKIASKLTDYNFYFFGSGPEKINCIKYCISNNLKNVFFKDFTSKPERAILNGFCYLSSSNFEGLPLSVLKAIYLERSICLSNVPGHKEFSNLNFKNIRYYKLGNIKSAVNCILKLYHKFNRETNKSYFDTFKAHYDLRLTVKKYNSIYI
jgi:hypothetical protein